MAALIYKWMRDVTHLKFFFIRFIFYLFFMIFIFQKEERKRSFE